MNYAILIYERKDDFKARTEPDSAATYWVSFKAYGDAIGAAQALRGGAALDAPGTGTTVRVKDGKRLVQDGPYADTKEQLGGFFLIEADNLDAALDWAAKCPAATNGVVEVRPYLPMAG
jgi:hypothetical protein